MKYFIRLDILKMYTSTEFSREEIDLIDELETLLSCVLKIVFGLKEFKLSIVCNKGGLKIENVVFKAGYKYQQDELEQKLNEWFSALINLRRQLLDIIYSNYDDVEKRAHIKEYLANTSPEYIGKKYYFLKRHQVLTVAGELSSPPFERQHLRYEDKFEIVENAFFGSHHFKRPENKSTKFQDTSPNLNGVPYCLETPEDLPVEIEFEPISSEEFNQVIREAFLEGCALVFSGILAVTEFTDEPKRYYVRSVHALNGEK